MVGGGRGDGGGVVGEWWVNGGGMVGEWWGTGGGVVEKWWGSDGRGQRSRSKAFERLYLHLGTALEVSRAQIIIPYLY